MDLSRSTIRYFSMHIYIYKYKCKFCKYELYTYIQGKENVSIMLYMVSGYDTNIYTYIHIYIYIHLYIPNIPRKLHGMLWPFNASRAGDQQK